jgi:dTDP-4-amino-4,6-dideoxygalactose transaminase
MRVPFVDLHAQYLAHQPEFDAAFREVIAKTAFIGGEYVRQFDKEFAQAYGVRHCIGVGNGTDAIYIVLKMLGIGPGDEVITTAASWISTSETISQTGATPVFVDVDEYYNIDIAKVAARIGPRTRALLPVHLYGQAAQVDGLAELARQAGIPMIEDCAQAHFAERAGRRVGTWGVAGTFSFYPGKNLGAYGDAGAIVTNDDDLARRCRRYANHGALVKHEHEVEGINSRLDGLQAALLSRKLPHVGAWTNARRRHAARYDRLLAGIPGVRIPRVRDGSTHVYHLYVIHCERRDALREWLTARQIETGIHYPTALPLLPAYRYMHVTAADVPNAAANQAAILSLPMYPEMTDSMLDYVVTSIRDFYGQDAVQATSRQERA